MYFRYLTRELRRRARSAAFVSIGMAFGVGLVITLTGAIAGVNAADGKVLQSLYGVGTDLTVTQAPAAGSGPVGIQISTKQGSGGSGSTTINGPGGTTSEPAAGDHVLPNPGLDNVKSSEVSAIDRLKGVAGAAGLLQLQVLDITSGGNISNFTLTGIDPTTPGVGLLSAGNISSGSAAAKTWFADAKQGEHVALVGSGYATQDSLKAGSTLTLSGTKYTVIGVVSLVGSTSSDVYIPLSQAQSIAGDSNKVNTIDVAATNSSAISAVQSEIQKLMPSATVTSASNLASDVTGSLSTASNLAGTLGLAVAIVVLVAAFVLAVLLTTGSVTRRVREFGTLKAIGWRSRRIVAQVMGESLVQGLIGGGLGVGVGYLGTFVFTKLVPTVQADESPGGGSTPTFGGPPQTISGGASVSVGGSSSGVASHTFGNALKPVTVHMTAPLSLEILLVAIALAVAGGLIAGAVGGWQASRLRPAAALRRVE
ncbi:MAG: ABC transporter permease [Candidatus Dormibacteria bacterium]